MPPLRAGQLRSLLTLQAKTITSDGQGGDTAVWVDVALVWARVVPADMSGEAYEAEQIVSRRKYVVTLRPRTVTSAMRLLRGTQVLEIVSVIPSDDMKDALMLECREGVPVEIYKGVASAAMLAALTAAGALGFSGAGAARVDVNLAGVGGLTFAGGVVLTDTASLAASGGQAFSGPATAADMANAAAVGVLLFSGAGAASNTANVAAVGSLPVALFRYTPGSSLTGATVSRSATGAYSDVNGVVQWAASNVLRDGHFIGAVRTTLIEALATNRWKQSQTFDVAPWGTNSASISPNAATAPDGTLTADKLVEAAATAVHSLPQSVTVTAAANTMDVYMKPSGRTRFFLRESSAVGFEANFDCTGAGAVLSNELGATSTITALTGAMAGWYRATMTFTMAAGTYIFTIGLLPNTGTSFANASYAGDGVSGILLWQADHVAASAASSTIVTTTGVVTRDADVLSWAAGVAQNGTYYERWLDPNTGAVTDSVTPYVANTAITPALDRAYTDLKIDTGTRTLAYMRAL